MVIETIILGFVAILVTVIVVFGGVIGISSYKTIALGLAEIGESGKNTRERINARADYEPLYDEGDAEAAGGMFSEFDGLARMMNYESAASALQDPAIIGKVKSVFSKNVQEDVPGAH